MAKHRSEGELTADKLDERERLAAAMLVGMAAGLSNLANAKAWNDGDKLEFSSCVDIARHMAWRGEPTTELDRMRVIGLVDDLMIGLASGDDAYRAMRITDTRTDLLAACKGALRIADLWLPAEEDLRNEQFREECAAVQAMHDAMQAAIAKAEADDA